MAWKTEIERLVIVWRAAALGTIDGSHRTTAACETTMSGCTIAGQAGWMARKTKRTTWIVIPRITRTSLCGWIYRSKQATLALRTWYPRSQAPPTRVMTNRTGLSAGAVVEISCDASASVVTQQLAKSSRIAGSASIDQRVWTGRRRAAVMTTLASGRTAIETTNYTWTWSSDLLSKISRLAGETVTSTSSWASLACIVAGRAY